MKQINFLSFLLICLIFVSSVYGFVLIELNNELISMDIKNVSVKKVFKLLEKKTGIQVFNKAILPDKKISIKFKNLNVEEGIKRLMQVSGIINYVIVYKTPKVIDKLFLLKKAPDVKQTKEPEITVSFEGKKGSINQLIKSISKKNPELAEKIKKELEERKPEPLED